MYRKFTKDMRDRSMIVLRILAILEQSNQPPHPLPLRGVFHTGNIHEITLIQFLYLVFIENWPDSCHTNVRSPDFIMKSVAEALFW